MTAEYAPGRPADVHGGPSPVTVLLWHGRGPNERHVLSPFAGLIAETGLRVVVPDWDSTADDGGRTDLLLSIKYARDFGAPLLVAGWSLGGSAAASLALNSLKLGLGAVPVVCLAGGFIKEDPLSGMPFAGLTVPGRNQGSIRLIHGIQDDIVDIAGSRAFAEVLRSAGWEADLTELDTDHAGIVGAGEPGRVAAAVIAATALRRRPDPRSSGR